MRILYRPLSSTIFLILVLIVLPLTALSEPDPCLVVYPSGPCTYHYDSVKYYTVTYGDPLYDPNYDRGGEVLIKAATNKIDKVVYQAPNLTGFVIATGGKEGYFLVGYSVDLIIDGWSNSPTVYHNIQIVFDPDPVYCSPNITVEGAPVTGPAYVYPIGDPSVSTPTPDGNNYSDTITKHIDWGGCYGILIWSYADENYNGVHDGGECFTAFSHDVTIPVRKTTWGRIKSLYE